MISVPGDADPYPSFEEAQRQCEVSLGYMMSYRSAWAKSETLCPK